MKKNRLLLSLLVLPLMVSCLDTQEYEMDGLQLQSSYALPLFKGKLGLKDFLQNIDSTTLGVRDDDVLYFMYQQDFEPEITNDLITIPDVGANEAFTVPAEVVVPANSEQKILGVENEMTIGSTQEFESILYKAGQLNYALNTTIGLPLEISIEFPSITRDGTPLSGSAISDAGGVANDVMSLEGAEADFTTSSTGNTLPYTIKITAINNTNSDFTIESGEKINAFLELVNQDFKLVKGFFGEMEAIISGVNLKVGPFDELLKYDINFSEINLEMKVFNQYGIPMTFSFPTFEALNSDGERMDLQTNPAGDIKIEAPNTPGEETVTPIKVENASELIKFNPEEINVEMYAELNKGQTTADNFITDTSKLSFNLSADIPLIGSFKNLIIQDTLAIDFKNDFGGLEVKKMALKTKLTNEFPFEGNFQVYLLDERQQVIDSLLSQEQTNIIPGSKVTSTGDLSEAGVYDEFIHISLEKLENLSNATQLLIKASLNTSPGTNNEFPNVKFKSGYTIDINLGLLTEIETSI